ncbi:MAG TPA: hypothetical protein VLZ06_11445 [Solirubrobacteraceae bacterium]|nr:hypothetical protein [Solirubrobacteraceae bacterium]
MGIRINRRLLLGACAAALAASALCTLGAQGATLPNMSIAVTKTSATVTGAPTSAGAINVVVSDQGLKEGVAILFRLAPGKTVAEAEQFIKEKRAHNDPNNTVELGSIVFDAEAESGKTNEAQTNLQPGTYLVLIGGGEGEPALRGTFTVGAATGAALAPPAPQATERTIDFGFKGPKTLHDGELVRFENEGFVVHMDLAFPVKNMKTAHKAVKDLLASKEKAVGKLVTGPPVGFYGPLSHGAWMQETITAKPGIYVQVCFMETQDGRDHATLGMERIIKITK